MDLQKIPSIQQKRTVTFINHFIIDTVSFLNQFINACENTLWELEKKMRKLETTLKLLEMKLNFIPESPEIENSSEVSSFAQSETKDGNQEKIQESILTDEENGNENESPEEILENNAEVQKYEKMVKVGVPVQAVKLKMKNDGFDPNLLKV